jgi:hypothetical protein
MCVSLSGRKPEGGAQIATPRLLLVGESSARIPQSSEGTELAPSPENNDTWSTFLSTQVTLAFVMPFAGEGVVSNSAKTVGALDEKPDKAHF